MKKSVCAFCVGLLTLCLGIGTAYANVIVSGTRVVFPARDGEVTLRLSNEGEQPALVEAWIDRGNPQSTPDQVDVPFLITPPLFRMNAHKGQSLRIVYTHEPLPADRESLFWLNVLEVPPKPTGPDVAGKNLLQLAIRSRLKLFFRPDGLSGDPLKAPAQLTWKTVATGASRALEVHNSTPYYITFNAVTVTAGGKDYSADTGMVAPLTTLQLAIPQLPQTPAAGTPITFTVINDYGAANSFKAVTLP